MTDFFGELRSPERMRANSLGATRLARALVDQSDADQNLLALGLAAVKAEGGFRTAGARAQVPSYRGDALEAQVAEVSNRLRRVRPFSERAIAAVHAGLNAKIGIDEFQQSVFAARPLARALLANIKTQQTTTSDNK